MPTAFPGRPHQNVAAFRIPAGRPPSRMGEELNLNEDPDVRETGGLPRVDEVGGSADEEDDRLADSFGSLDVDEPDDEDDA